MVLTIHFSLLQVEILVVMPSRYAPFLTPFHTSGRSTHPEILTPIAITVPTIPPPSPFYSLFYCTLPHP